MSDLQESCRALAAAARAQGLPEGVAAALLERGPRDASLREAALRWLADLEAEAQAREAWARRPAPEAPPADAPSVDGWLARRRIHRERAAQRLAEGGLAGEALALLAEPLAPPAPGPGARERALAAAVGVVGGGGIPALTPEELAALQGVEDPAEARALLAAARERISALAQEARAWLERGPSAQEARR